VGEQAVVSCVECGHPLPADAEFCPSCGKASEPKRVQAEAQPQGAANGDHDPEATVIRAATVGAGEDGPEQPDRWED
jgi:hypothetical protein